MSKNEGLYDKFIVRRTDGRSEPGRKHHGCRYFVIDIDHDERAAPALAAYARAARADGDVRLAEDLEQIVRWRAETFEEFVEREGLGPKDFEPKPRPEDQYRCTSAHTPADRKRTPTPSKRKAGTSLSRPA